MATPDERSPGPQDDYTVAFTDDSDWFDLLGHDGSRESARQLAARHVAGFDPLPLAVARGELEREITRLALEAHEDGAINAGAAFAQDGTLLAVMAVHCLGEDGVTRPTPEEFLPQVLSWSDAKVKGEPEVSRPDLAPGPAVRARLLFAEKRLLGWGSRLSEAVRYAVWPAGQEEILTLDVWWRHPERGEELAAMADALAQGMRLVPDGFGGAPQPGSGTADEGGGR